MHKCCFLIFLFILNNLDAHEFHKQEKRRLCVTDYDCQYLKGESCCFMTAGGGGTCYNRSDNEYCCIFDGSVVNAAIIPSLRSIYILFFFDLLKSQRMENVAFQIHQLMQFVLILIYHFLNVE